MAIAPDLSPSNPQKSPADSASVFKPITPVNKPTIVPEPENPGNPFVALSPALTNVDLPLKKANAPSPTATYNANKQTPVVKPPPKPANFLFENISINIAPEFMPPKPAPPLKTAMDFSMDYKNPEAEKLLNHYQEKPECSACFKCGKTARSSSLLNSTKGAVCPRCFNPYFHRLISSIFHDREDVFTLAGGSIALLHFITAWIVPTVPAIIWYTLFVRTGFGGFFEDGATILFAPTFAGMTFVFLLIAGLFLIPAGIASVALGKTVSGSLTRIFPNRLFSIIRSAMPGYFAVFFFLTVSTVINLAGIALCVEKGMGWASNVSAVALAIVMSAVEMEVVKIVFSPISSSRGSFPQTPS